MGYQGFFEILMITLISSKKLGVCNNMRYTVGLSKGIMDHKIVVFAIEKTCQFLHSVNMRTIQFSMHWLGGLHYESH